MVRSKPHCFREPGLACMCSGDVFAHEALDIVAHAIDRRPKDRINIVGNRRECDR